MKYKKGDRVWVRIYSNWMEQVLIYIGPAIIDYVSTLTPEIREREKIAHLLHLWDYDVTTPISPPMHGSNSKAWAIRERWIDYKI